MRIVFHSINHKDGILYIVLRMHCAYNIYNIIQTIGCTCACLSFFLEGERRWDRLLRSVWIFRPIFAKPINNKRKAA